MATNPHCEVSPLLRLWGMESFTGWPLEIHHLIGGSGRVDAWSNLVTVNRATHRWIERNPRDGRIVCLILKGRKGELNPADFRQFSGQLLAGWVSNNEPHNSLLRPAWEQLAKLCESL